MFASPPFLPVWYGPPPRVWWWDLAVAQFADGPAATIQGARQGPREYTPPPQLPTQEGPNGIRFDFNDGCRVYLPASDHPWRVRLTDLDSGNVLFETELKSGRVNSTTSASGSRSGRTTNCFLTTIPPPDATC
jgi:hypothetical protein